MKCKFILIGFLTSLVFNNANAQNKVDFLKQNALPISIDVNNTDFSDLQKLKEYIGDNRLVMLGEESHGDGTTFETKTRIIKFLHEQMKFNVLAFESNFYNAEKAWEKAQTAEKPMIPLQESVFHLWSHSNETQPLFQYIASNIHHKNPLKITGFDCQYNGKFIAESAKDLSQFLDQNNVQFNSENEKNNFYSVYNRTTFKTKDSLNKFDLPLFKKSIDTIIVQLKNLKTPKKEFWLQHFISSRDNILGLLEQLNERETNKLRDSVMAQNLLWLLNKGYQNEKIIVWAHNYHIAKGEVTKNIKTMGQFLKDSLGASNFYSVGFIAYGGQFGWFDGQYQSKIRKPIPSSFENLFRKTKIENSFLDLRTLSQKEDGKWLYQTRNLRFHYYIPSTNNWPNVYDGLIYNHIMKKSTNINLPKTQGAYYN